MLIRIMSFALLSFFSLFILAASVRDITQPVKGGEPPLPPVRKIPGVTTRDSFPRGCVDCHINYTKMNMDVRISTLMKRWMDGVEPKLLAKVKVLVPTGVALTGRHPAVGDALKNIPGACYGCHNVKSQVSPPFAPMMHALHLNGGEKNHFLTIFQGECTHCHKFNNSAGEWSVPSGPER